MMVLCLNSFFFKRSEDDLKRERLKGEMEIRWKEMGMYFFFKKRRFL